MKFYWSQNDIPELKGLSSDLKKKAKAAAIPEVWKHWQVWLSFLTQVILFIALFLFLPASPYRLIILLAYVFVTMRLEGLLFNHYLQQHLAKNQESESGPRD